MNIDKTFANLGVRTTADAAAAKSAEQGQLLQEDFLKLMTTQLSNQSPLDPADNSQFLAQMAQFATVSGIQDLQKSFTEFAGAISSNQALQASSLVGKNVLIPSNNAVLGITQPLSGQVELNGATDDVVIEIASSGGVKVHELHLGPNLPGAIPFQWDGQLADGSQAAPGTYQISARAGINGQTTALETFATAGVQAVNLGGNQGLQLELKGLGAQPFNQVRQIFQ
ncbi:MAG: flagellar hook assembly protein FlgD [Methylococcales bacterium]|nr:flagellar hook assembly protein FlgD [Methylococcales bacterium]